MEGTDEPAMLCTVCREEMQEGEDYEFGGAPVCINCTGNLNLRELDTGSSDELLSRISEAQGQDILGEFLALARSISPDYGWNILAIVGNISESVEDEQARSLLESSTMLSGLTVLRLGEGEGEPDPGLLSLLLVLGQVVDLSVMRKIVLGSGLRMSNKLDELILIGEHNRVLFEMIKDIDHGGDEQKEMILSICLAKIV
ncbi:MAG: hypothetical protein ACMUHU_06280 [Thermoplasmatota archaeon]